MVVSVEIVEPATSAKFFSSMSTSVQKLEPDEGVILSLAPPAPTPAGEQAKPVMARVLNGTGPFDWTWTGGKGDAECLGCASELSIAVPFYGTAGKYPVSVTVSDKNGYDATAQVDVVITEDDWVDLENIHFTDWEFLPPPSESEVYYYSRINNQAGIAPYTFKWSVSPTGETRENVVGVGEPAVNSLIAPLPGLYGLHLTVTDNSDPPRSFHQTDYFGVGKEFIEPPVAEIIGLDGNPAASAGESHSFSVTAREGMLIYSGNESGYTVEVDFGDGTSKKTVEKLLSDNPDYGASTTVSHTWATEGTYDVTATVFDASGKKASTIHQVVVGPPPPFLVEYWSNIGGTSGYNNTAENAMVQINGTRSAAVISWTGIEAGSVYVRGFDGTYHYGIRTNLEDQKGNPIPIQSPVTFGDYSVPGTVPGCGYPYSVNTPQDPAIPLKVGDRYEVIVSTPPYGASAYVNVLVNGP